MRARHFVVVTLTLVLSACSVRSISNAGPPGDSYNSAYRGELNELDVLVPDNGEPVTEARIQAALTSGGTVHAELGKSLLVIQSGAFIPDPQMIAALEPVFRVVPFSGVPSAERDGLARRLRLAAAEGGYHQILCYWGQLEAAQQNEVTKVVSWVPIVGLIVPDESQQMRIRLKAAIIDVETGRWRFVMPPPIEDERFSARINRRTADQDQVTRLKTSGYASLARALIEDATQVSAR